MALDYDFYLTSGATSLGFNKKITAETPEERATAQFRKEQFDSTPTVGDQSLSGWWTRGQPSFHKGAGVKFYEVLDGEAVLNRFDTGTEIRAIPGELTLAPLRSATSATSVSDVVPVNTAGAGGAFLLRSGTSGAYANIGSVTEVATSTGGSPTSITTDGERFYWVNGDKIEVQSGSTSPRTNYVTNPSFEASTANWTKSSNATWTRTTAWSKYGTRSMSSDTGASPTTAEIYAETALTGLTNGATYYVSAWFGKSNTTVSLLVDGATIDSDSSGDVVKLEGTFVASGTTATVRVNKPDGPNYYGFQVDAVLVTESPWPGDYFDGSTTGAVWNGTAHLSTSTWATSATSATTALVTTTDSTWSQVFYAKGRLFAVATDGRWYSAAKGVASSKTTADAFWASGTAKTWRMCDGPGAAYISDGSSIYAVSIDASGQVPSLATPTTVCTVPAGETISSITYYLGYVILTTTAGVRLALVADDGSLRLGPLVVEADCTACVRAGVFDNTAYVVGKFGADQVLIALNLAEQVPGLDIGCAWTPRGVLTSLSSTASGAAVDGVGRVWAWAAGSLFYESLDELSSPGYVRTGYHRFGTLDQKWFASLAVRASGYGTVAVATVDPDGTETALGTLSAADGVAEYPISAATERLRLKFTLTRDASDAARGPTLLGYQLKALPLPKRQRMKRVPLALFDREQNRIGQEMGNDGSAWTRLQALEALETANAVVDFEDKETGETGSAYIESVEMRRTAPTSRHGDGFGGTIWLTLRAI